MVPAAPLGTQLGSGFRLSHQSKVGNREIVARIGAGIEAPEIAESIELFNIAESQSCLLLHPGAQAGFKRSVIPTERSRRQSIALGLFAGENQDLRFGIGDRNDYRR